MTRSGRGGEAQKEFKEKFSVWECLHFTGMGGEEGPKRGAAVAQGTD